MDIGRADTIGIEPANEASQRCLRSWTLFMALAVTLAWATAGAIASASAGEYHVYSCRTPSGAFAGADGWSHSINASDKLEADGCSSGGALVAALYSGVTQLAGIDVATWGFTAPSGDRIAQATLWRAGNALGGASGGTTYSFWLAGPMDRFGTSDVFSRCVAGGCGSVGDSTQPFSIDNRVDVPGSALGQQSIYLNASCDGSPKGTSCAAGATTNGYAADIHLYAADIVLSQDSGPSVTNVEGGLASTGLISGTTDISLTGEDAVSGVFEASFEIDGTVVKTTVLDPNDGRCRNVGQTDDGLFAFLYVRPCPALVSTDIPFDTTTLTNGQHHLTVKVLDAAGNSVTALDRTITVLNPQAAGAGGGAGTPGLVSSVGGGSLRGAANGTDASDQATLTAGWVRGRGTTFVGRYGHVAQIAGRLVGADRRGVGGAALDLVWTPNYPGARSVGLPVVRTASDGTFRVRLPATSSSGSVRISYRSHVADLTPVAVRTLRLDVRAAVVLHVAPRVASVGRTISFDGQILGGPIPAGGKQLVLEARSPGSAWIDFRVIRTDRRGRFHSTYRFRFAGPARYQFRALSKYEVAFPFISGASNVVAVRER
jgi:hypothetical protein